MSPLWFKGFWRSWQQQTTMQLATLSVLIGTFIVVTIFVLVHRNLNRILTGWGDSVRMSVFLEDGLSEEETTKIQNLIENLGKFKKVQFVSKASAASQFRDQMASQAPDFLNDPQFGNPLPPSFEASLKDDIPISNRLATMEKMAQQVQQIPGVEDIYYGQGWVENYSVVVKAFSLTSWILIAVLLSGSLFIIGNSIRNAISQRREEIEVLELVGATPEMIRIPYVLEGFIMGLLAGSLAIFFVYLLFRLQSSLLKAQMGFLQLNKYLGFLTFFDVILLIFLAGLFGGAGAFFCVRKLCNGWTAANKQELFR